MDLSNHYPESPPAVKGTKKRREQDLRLALLNPVYVIICSAQNGFSRGYSEFYYLLSPSFYYLHCSLKQLLHSSITSVID